MCGIAGLINLNGEPVSPAILKKMTDTIAHRGPDGEGHWIDANVGIGHRRLAIIDVSTVGHQPMQTHDNRYILSYNGEIYNYIELRTELEALGYWFKSQTDSEVVLYALAHWGQDALLKFNGMFAFAFWDRKEQSLLLARDRYGIKPIYYSAQGSHFTFASEYKAITSLPVFNKKLNKQALFEYFTFQNIFTNQTLLEDVNLLPAGHFAKFSLASGRLSQTQYWDYDFCEPAKILDKREYVEELDRLFKQAVNRQLVGDVEMGAYLSGGMDSGSITAIAAKSLPYLKTFTCGFDLSSASGMELAFDERSKAEAMSAVFKTEHYEMVLKAGDMERSLSKVAWHLDEPRVGQSYPNYYAAKLASKFVKVVFGGTGGDELFAGYPWRYYRSFNCSSFAEYIDGYYQYWQRLLSHAEMVKMFEPIASDVADVSTRSIFRNVFRNQDTNLEKPADFINKSLYFEAKTFLNGLFIVEDKLNMAHGLENRVPFMDNDLVEFAMQCPVELKLNNLSDMVTLNENEIGKKTSKHHKHNTDGKQILREMMSRHIPSYVTEGAKQGFSSPDASWFKGESIDYVKTKLLSKNAKIYDIFNPQTVNDLLQTHFTGKQNRRLLIWSLLSTEHFLDEF